ncbi:MAG TPA: XrtA/PEP-CTERM system TPR-repeat protein PrsT [Methylophilaceae bacterium]|nr:XrtA/PEP-CTERM system TPR-repeat protein PrsT [Methylophilaceae bacterium]
MPKRINSHTRTIAMLLASVLMLSGIVSCEKPQTPEALIAEARQYQQKGDTPAAIIQLKNALQKNPDNAEARFLLGTIYNEAGDPKSAEKELRRAEDLGMSRIKVLPELGKALFAQGQFQQVLDETQRLAGAKESPEILSLRGNAYLALRKNQEAKAAFEQALGSQPDFPAALIGLSRYALMEKNVEEAIRLSDQAVVKNPKNAEAWLFKADLLRAQGKIEQALAAYDQTLKLQPKNTTAHINKAFLEIGLGKFDIAKTHIDAARAVAPNSLLVFYTQALLDFRQGKHAEAWDALQQILRAAPEHMPSVLLAGAVQYAMGSLPQAEHYLKSYLEKDPKNPYARKVLLSTLLRAHKTDSAFEVLRPALQNSQQDFELLRLAGETYMQAKDFEKAEEYFEKAAALSPKDANVHTALGISKLAQGEDSRAIAELEMASNLDSLSSRPDLLLVITHLRKKEFDLALNAAKNFEKDQPNNPLSHNLKGVAYLGKKDYANARASFEKATAIQPNFFPAVANLAQLDLVEKKPERAKQRFEALLAKDKKNFKAMNALANLALAQGQKKEATAWLERASKENPDALEPALQLAAHYLRMGEKQKALALAQQLQGSYPDSPEILDILAQAQFANGDKQAALDTYNRLAAMRPNSALAQLRIASMHKAMQNPQAATAAFKKALELQPDNLEAQMNLAALEAHNGRYDQAVAIARTIQKQRAKSPAGYLLEGDLLMAQKKPDLAAKLYEQAHALSKGGFALIKLHEALTNAGKGKEADARLVQWVKEHPADHTTRLYLAGTFLAAKQNEAAIEQYQIILRLNPNYVPALNNLAWLLHQQNDARALGYAEQANKLKPDNAAILDTLGWILVEQGNVARGLPLLQKAASLAPAAPVIRYHLAVGLMKSGDKAKAKKELEQLLASGKNFSQAEEARALLKKL